MVSAQKWNQRDHSNRTEIKCQLDNSKEGLVCCEVVQLCSSTASNTAEIDFCKLLLYPHTASTKICRVLPSNMVVGWEKVVFMEVGNTYEPFARQFPNNKRALYLKIQIKILTNFVSDPCSDVWNGSSQ
ncbi:hypothetical protein FQA47_024681 [Oryzias melastigma]|uniref:Uncharacterized protein n=1 Tax=Oryzias melastigma TaxID=30732 RepID=A0A834F370_ORYME|nr:hypothetical protein FQA47_024681 [Oryzias melastigma]